MPFTWAGIGRVNLAINNVKRSFVPHISRVYASVGDIKRVEQQIKLLEIHEHKEQLDERKGKVHEFVVGENWTAAHFILTIRILADLMGNIFYDINHLAELLNEQHNIDIMAKRLNIVDKSLDKSLIEHLQNEHAALKKLMGTIMSEAGALVK